MLRIFVFLALLVAAVHAASFSSGFSSLMGGASQTFSYSTSAFMNLVAWKYQPDDQTARILQVAPGADGLVVTTSDSMISLVDYDGGHELNSVQQSALTSSQTPLEILTMGSRVFIRYPSSIVSYNSMQDTSVGWTWTGSFYSMAVCGNYLYTVHSSGQIFTFNLNTNTQTTTFNAYSQCNLTCNPSFTPGLTQQNGALCLARSGIYSIPVPTSSTTSPYAPTLLYPFSGNSAVMSSNYPSVASSGSIYFFATLTSRSPSQSVLVGLTSASCSVSFCLMFSVPFIPGMETGQIAVDDTALLLFTIGNPTSWAQNLVVLDARSGMVLSSMSSVSGVIAVDTTNKMISLSETTGVTFYSYNVAGVLTFSSYMPLSFSGKNSATGMAKTIFTQSGTIVASVSSGCSQLVFADATSKLPTSGCTFASPSHHLAAWAIVLIVFAVLFCVVCIACCIRKRRNNMSYNAMLAEGIPVGIVTGTHV